MEDLCFGGTQKQNLELACRLNTDAFFPSILTLTGPTDLDNQALAKGLTPYYLGVNRKVPRFFPFTLGKALHKLKPDILVNCTALPNIWGRIWGKILQIPVIIGTCRGGGALERQHEKLLWRMCNHLVCNSSPLAQRLIKTGIPASRISYIPNGVDTEYFTPVNKNIDNSINLLCVARLVPDKDLSTLLEAFALVAASDSRIRLELVGAGSEEQNLKNLAHKMPKNIHDRIKFIGADADTKKYYDSAHIFCLSSVREGQPNSILEAMACALPVISTRVGGIPDIVEDGKSGLLSAVRDKSAMAENIFKLLNDVELRQNMGQRGREIVKSEFSFSAMVGAHENLFKLLWNNYRSRKGKPALDR